MSKPKLVGYSWTDEQIRFIIEERDRGSTFVEIADEFNSRFGKEILKEKSPENLRAQYGKYKDFDFTETEMLQNIRSQHSARKSRSKTAKENRLLLDEIERRDEIIEAVHDLIKTNPIGKVKVIKPKFSKKKKNLEIEMPISDVHVGLQTPSYNLEVCEKRVEAYTATTLGEIDRLSKNYNVKRIQMNFNGDLIQGEHLHGSDSQSSCEFSDARQMAEAIRIFFFKVILPIASTGIKVDILGMCGNHDRQGKARHIHKAGERYLTYTIYRAMEMLCQASGLTNVNWIIPIKEYAVFYMFDTPFIIEHGHAAGIKPTVVSLEKQLLKRGNQFGIIPKGIRIGHYHGSLLSNNGRHIVIPSPVSDDPFGDHLGYVSYPAMLLNYYVETKSRTTSYYHSFEVNLEDIT